MRDFYTDWAISIGKQVYPEVAPTAGTAETADESKKPTTELTPEEEATAQQERKCLERDLRRIVDGAPYFSLLDLKDFEHLKGLKRLCEKYSLRALGMKVVSDPVMSVPSKERLIKRISEYYAR